MVSSFALADYQIGIICALETELAAIRAILDEEHGLIDEKEAEDDNVYFAGRIHQHNVVIASLPAGRDGIAAAAIVAKNIGRTFCQLRFGLLVGIGGGIPDLENGVDIRLGDVVVSQPDGVSSGVVQYDKGKRNSNISCGWERKGFLNAPPGFLLHALRQLQADHEINDCKMKDYLSKVIIDHPKMGTLGYIYPGSEADVFYVNTKPKIRPTRPTTTPALHYGTIASGNSVIKNVVERDRIKQECSALCVEMEAAGLMNDLPCIVIRGISDYADEHKNDQWHRYAALTAAAFAKELLFYISTQRAKSEVTTGTALDSIHQATWETLERAKVQEERARHLECHQALYTSRYTDHKDINRNAVTGTCQWLLQHDKFREWYQDPHSTLLWISADPGCGKSVLSKYLVDEFFQIDTESTPHSICHFFFKDNPDQDSLSIALCAILHQLLTHQPNLIQYVMPLWETNGPGLTNEVSQLWQILQNIAKDRSTLPTICVIDGLDECREHDRKRFIYYLCQYYQQYASSSHASMKFLVTSRPYDDIQNAFEEVPPQLPTIRIRGEDENDSIHEEINLVLNDHVRELTRQLNLSQRTAERIKKSLQTMRNRTYIWLRLVLDHIKSTFQLSLRPEQEPIILLPRTVDEAYEQLLSRIAGNSEKHKVKVILSIIIAARRPLKVQEMALALDVATGDRVSSVGDFRINAEWLKDKIRQWCGLFIFINHDKIYLLHQTAKEFLVWREHQQSSQFWSWKGCLRLDDTEALMARICVQYLLLSEFDHEILSPWMPEHDLWDSAQQRKPVSQLSLLEANGLLTPSDTNMDTIIDFFKYASQHWPHHYRQVDGRDTQILQSVLKLYDCSNLRFRRLTALTSDRSFRGFNHRSHAILSSTINGHSSILNRLLAQNLGYYRYRDLVSGKTPLMLAAQGGHSESVSVLLSYGAEFDSVCEPDTTALSCAAAEGHVQIMRMLLSRQPEASLDLTVPLIRALQNGHSTVVDLVHERGFDFNTPLCLKSAVPPAADPGMVGIWEDDSSDHRFLTNYTDFGTALHVLASTRDTGLLRKIIGYGGDVRAWCEASGSVLQTACYMYDEGVFNVLWNEGAGFDAETGVFVDIDAFLTAVKHCAPNVVQRFLDAKVDVNAEGSGGKMALQIACARRNHVMVQLLLSGGAELNAVSSIRGTALQIASEQGDIDLVSMFLRTRGIDVNVKAGRYGTALQAASANGWRIVVELLLEAGAKVDNDCGEYGSSLHAAASQGHIDIIGLLVEAGFDVDSWCPPIGTALQAAVLEGQRNIAKRLLQLGANSMGKGGPFDCALCAARVNDYYDLEVLLFTYGATCPDHPKFFGTFYEKDAQESSESSDASPRSDMEIECLQPIPVTDSHSANTWNDNMMEDASISIAELTPSPDMDGHLSPTEYYDILEAEVLDIVATANDRETDWVSSLTETEPQLQSSEDCFENTIQPPSPSNCFDPSPLYLLEGE